MKSLLRCAVVAAGLCTVVLPAVEAKNSGTGTLQSIPNLMIAHNEAANAKERYLAFAVKADREGYPKTARLFRAMSKSYDIHAAFLVKALAELGGQAKPIIKVLTGKSTKENLETAIKNENETADMLYPRYMEQAKNDKAQMAGMAFGSGIALNKNRVPLLKKALAELGTGKEVQVKFYVCKVCGNVTDNLDFEACAVCDAPKTEFEEIN